MKLKGLNIIHNSCLIELDIFWWKLKRKVVKINIFTFLQMSGARRLFIWNKGYNFTRHHTIKAYQAFISPILPWTGRWWSVSRGHLYQEMVLSGCRKPLTMTVLNSNESLYKNFKNQFQFEEKLILGIKLILRIYSTEKSD